MEKLLIAVDGTESSMRALEYVGAQFSSLKTLKFTLLHVLPNLPASFWDDGHILSEEETRLRHRLVEDWSGRQTTKAKKILEAAEKKLASYGIDKNNITRKFIGDSGDIADSILDTASNDRFGTIVLGRRGIAQGHHRLIGSVTSKVIHKGAGVAICIVE